MSAFRMFLCGALSVGVGSCATNSRPYNSTASSSDSTPTSDAGFGASSSHTESNESPAADAGGGATSADEAQTTERSGSTTRPTDGRSDAGEDGTACNPTNAFCNDSSNATSAHDTGAETNASAAEPSSATDSTATDSSDVSPCVAETPDQQQSVFASPSGTDSAGCGLAASPCRTVKQALARAVAAFRTHVLLEQGEFQEAETLEVPAGITIQGGWSREGSSWQRTCESERTSHSVLLSGVGVAVRTSEEGHVLLDWLTIRTKEVGDAGESLYGIWLVGARSHLTLNEVDVFAGTAGSGQPGAAGETLAGPQTCETPGTGAKGDDGANGQTLTSAFTRAGYVAGDGTRGEDGKPGETGVTGTTGTVICVPYDGNCNHAPTADYTLTALGGKGGCGGGPGTSGTGGHGGGSSVALYVSQGTVTITGGSLVAGAGGNGGEGGLGGAGGTGRTGLAGEEKRCPTQCNQNRGATGGRGGTGGAGGAGGKGGSGAGGNSVALVYAADAVVEHSGVTLETGQAGRGLGDGPLGFSEKTHEFTP